MITVSVASGIATSIISFLVKDVLAIVRQLRPCFTKFIRVIN